MRKTDDVFFIANWAQWMGVDMMTMVPEKTKKEVYVYNMWGWLWEKDYQINGNVYVACCVKVFILEDFPISSFATIPRPPTSIPYRCVELSGKREQDSELVGWGVVWAVWKGQEKKKVRKRKCGSFSWKRLVKLLTLIKLCNLFSFLPTHICIDPPSTELQKATVDRRWKNGWGMVEKSS